MKKLLFTTLLALIVNLTMAQQIETINKFDGESIYGIIVDGAFDLRFCEGNQTGVKIEIRGDNISKLEVEMTDEGYVRLGFGSDVGQFLKGKNRPYVEVVVDELRHLELSGNTRAIGLGECYTKDICNIQVGTTCSLEDVHIEAPIVNLYLTGAAKVEEVTIVADDAKIDLSNSSKAIIKGTLGTCNVRTGGTSSLSMLMVESQMIEAVVSGMSIVKANVSKEANVKCTGTASFKYIGDGKLEGDGKKI